MYEKKIEHHVFISRSRVSDNTQSKRLLQQEVQQLHTIGNHTTRDWPVCTAFEDLLRRSGEEAFATKIAVRGTDLRDIAVNRAGFSPDGKLVRGEANERRKGCMCANDPSLSFS